jgi:UPF0716 protein FxsA
MRFMSLLLLFPLIELFVIILLSSYWGIGTTLLLFMASIILGVYLIKSYGTGHLKNVATKISSTEGLQEAHIRGAFYSVAGLLFIIPGFLTDIFAMLLFIPAYRRFLIKQVAPSFTVLNMSNTSRTRPHNYGGMNQDGDVIDGEYEVVPPTSVGNDNQKS